jgi:membrane protein required for colicin V production
MLEAQLSYFDLTVIAVIALSCVFAFFRGLVKEVLSLGAWIGAGLITLYYFRDVALWLKPHFKNEMIAGGLATLGLYIVCLICFSILNSIIIRFVKEGGDVGFLDNTLGLAFGAFRGTFLIALGYLIMSMFISADPEQQPAWLKNAWTKPFAEKSALLLARAAPDYLQAHSSLKDKLEDGMKRYGEEEYTTPEEKKSSKNEINALIKHMKQRNPSGSAPQE